MSLEVGSLLGFSGHPTSPIPAVKVWGDSGSVGGLQRGGWGRAHPSLHLWATRSCLGPSKGDTNSLEHAPRENAEPLHQAASSLVLPWFFFARNDPKGN